MVHLFKPLLWVVFIVAACTGLAWQNNPSTGITPFSKDTIPKEKNGRTTDKTVINGDLDKAIEEVKKAKESLDRQLQNKNWEKIHQELEHSLQQLNAENIQEQLAKAMKDIDFQKIQLQAQAALKQVDWQKMQAEMLQAQEAIKNNFDAKKMEAELQRAMEQTKKAMAELKAVDMEKIQQELEKARDAMKIDQGRMKEDIEKAKKEIKENLQKDFRKEFENARREVERAREELQNYKNMLTEMDKDSLLKAGEPYSIEYKNAELIINGKTQPAAVTGKCRHYFKKDNVQIRKGEDDDKTIHL